jgi:hypothetical protein
VVPGSDLFVLVRRAPGLACRVRGGILAGAGTVPPCDVDDSSSSDAIRSAERRAFSSYQGEREREKKIFCGSGCSSSATVISCKFSTIPSRSA